MKKITAVAVSLMSFAAMNALAAEPTEAIDMRVTRQTAICPARSYAEEGLREDMAGDIASMAEAYSRGGCKPLLIGTRVKVVSDDGAFAYGRAFYPNGTFDGHIPSDALITEPSIDVVAEALNQVSTDYNTSQLPAAFVLQRGVYICRSAVYAELYQSRLDISDLYGAFALIKENDCKKVRKGETITARPYDTNEPDNMLGTPRKVYWVEALVDGVMTKGYMPMAQLR